MADLRTLFKVGQKVKCKNPDNGRFDNGIVKETHEDHMIVDVENVCDHMMYMNGFNMDLVFPEYNF